jgi:hypothetical protein
MIRASGPSFGAKLGYYLFGFGVGEPEFCSRYKDSGFGDTLENVALRVYLVRQMRDRLTFDIPQVSPFPTEEILADWLHQQMDSIQIYLLCNCIDALASEEQYVDFPGWLAVTKKKAEYHIDDEKIAAILRDIAGDMRTPDVFRKAATKLCEEVYRPTYGNHRLFRRFFDDLPLALQQVIADAYFVSDSFIAKPGSIQQIRDAEQRKWNSRPLEEKIRAVADYLYNHRRNPFTHSAETFPKLTTQSLHWRNEPTSYRDRQDSQRGSYVLLEDNKARIVRFHGESGEDEVLMLLLVVTAGWLSKLGCGTMLNAAHLSKIRKHYLRRNCMPQAMNEIGVVRDPA